MSESIDRIRQYLADPSAPWYGSNIVPLVADLCDENERLWAASQKRKNDNLPGHWDDEVDETAGDSPGDQSQRGEGGLTE